MDAKVLAAALLWLRNHYEVGDPELKNEVIDRIDRVLEHIDLEITDMERFRQLFPRTGDSQ
jgi:hypothetical protein